MKKPKGQIVIDVYLFTEYEKFLPFFYLFKNPNMIENKNLKISEESHDY